MTDNIKNQLILNRLDKTQYDNAGTINNQEIYLVDPLFKGNRIVVTDSNGGLTEAESTVDDIPGVINATTSTSTTDALSANMGRELQAEIDNLKARGRFLALWNCATGLPASDPVESPYLYKAGDYYIVGTVASGSGTNYKPSGASYVTGVPSTTIESSEVTVDDVYYYDGTQWRLQSNAQKTLNFASIAGDPYDNTNLATALNGKVSDVQINSTSIVDSSDYTAYIPTATTANSSLGVVKVNDAGYGIFANTDGQLRINPGDYGKFSSLNAWLPMVVKDLLLGMKKFLGTTITSTTSNSTWTDTETKAARLTLGCTGDVTVGGTSVKNADGDAEIPYPVVFVNYSE